MNCLNVQISAYDNSIDDQIGVAVDLQYWLTNSALNERLKPYSAVLRDMESERLHPDTTPERRKELKAYQDQFKREYLPAITPGGLFRQRGESNLLQATNLLQLDIDLEPNAHLNLVQLKAQISKVKNIAYCAISARGNGLWALVPISDYKDYKAHFGALEVDFKAFGVVIDPAVKNVAGLRFYSYDPDPYINPAATVYTKKKVIQAATATQGNAAADNNLERLISKIEDARIDITGAYNEWFAIGCGLANTFGEAGRHYFHRISQFYSGYEVSATDKQFDACIKGGRTKGRYTVATVFELAKDYGVMFKE